jgi:C-terminal processing protease CtpA/Prc
VRKAGRPTGWVLCAAIAGAPVSAQDWQIVDPFEPGLLMDQPSQRLQNVADVPLDMTLLEIVRKLDAPEFHAREEAAQQIIERADDKIKLYAILDHGNLTVEQRYRLLQVVREFLLEMPRGAVGISMDGWQPGMALQDGGVRVADLVPGMPAERVLQVGDRIIAIDGHPLATQNDLII